MRETDVEVILQRAKEKYLEAKPRIISDNGPQFIARDFKEFIRISGMTHVRTSPNYPQSNGKIERWHKSLKGECIRPGTPLSLEDARRLVKGYVEHYNNVSFEQRHRVHHAEGHARRVSARDSGQAGSEIGSSEGTAEEAPPAGRVTDETGTEKFRRSLLFLPLVRAALRQYCRVAAVDLGESHEPACFFSVFK